jgi:hypothetical protein
VRRSTQRQPCPDFCAPDCQTAWHAQRTTALPADDDPWRGPSDGPLKVALEYVRQYRE